MGRRIGYARVSTDDQDLAIQKTALDKHGCAIVFEEKRSGTRRTGREQLELALKVLTKGDTLVVTRLDRLGRSLRDLANITHEIETAGANLRMIEQSVDTGTSAGRAFFGMLAVIRPVRDRRSSRATGRGHRQGQEGRRLHRRQAEDRPAPYSRAGFRRERSGCGCPRDGYFSDVGVPHTP